MEPRSQDTMRERFTTKPGDIFTIQSKTGVLSRIISVSVKNGNEQFYLSFKNDLDAWKVLKRVNEIPGRSVMFQSDDNTPIPLKNSVPYDSRF